MRTIRNVKEIQMSQQPNKRQQDESPIATSGSQPPSTQVAAVQTVGICVLLVILVFAAFGQTVRHGFVTFDDDRCVYQNPVVTKGLSFGNVGWAFTHSEVGHWDPLTTLSHMLDCQFYGLHPWGHHLTNVLLHAVGTALLFLMLREMTGLLWRSGFAAALWAVHPLRVESVAWVAERKDVLSGIFFMLTLWAYVRYARSPALRGRYAMVVLWFVLGLMSKSMLVTLPFVLLLLDYWPLRRFEAGLHSNGMLTNVRQLVVEKIPLLLLSAAFAVVQMQADREALLSLDNTPLAQRLGNAVVTYGVYLRQMVWPVDMGVYYPHPGNELSWWEVALVLMVLCAVSAGVIVERKKQPWLAVGWLWYLGMLVPVIGIVQSGGLARADRYTYLPQIGLFVSVTWMVADCSGKVRNSRAFAIVISGIVLSALLVAAFHQTSYWRDSITLWTHTIGCTRDNEIAHNNLGVALVQQGRVEEAVAHYREALRITPTYLEARKNLGGILLRNGKLEEAIAQFRIALLVNPTDADTHFNLGDALLQQRETEEAAVQFRETLLINPDNAKACYYLGNTLLQQGHNEEAVISYREALRINPNYAYAHFNLGGVLLQQGRDQEAIAHVWKALELLPNNASVQNSVAWILATAPQPSMRNGAKALELAMKADKASGGSNPNFLRTFAAAQAETGQFPAAAQTAKRALQLAQTQSNDELVSMIRREIELYGTGRRFENSDKTR
jgi:tetratricopeptide (TPR) repeat protein